jgi:hypothetical protein
MKFLYYRLWQLFTKIKTNDMPATNAMIFISLCQFFNFSLIYFFLLQYSIINIHFNKRSEVLFYTIPLGIIVYIINYFYLYKNRERLYEKYKNEGKKRKIIGNILLILYVVGSFALVFYFGPKYSASVMK